MADSQASVLLFYQPYKRVTSYTLPAGEISGAKLRETLGVPSDFGLWRQDRGRRVGTDIGLSDTLFVRNGDVFVADGGG